ncbi:hypothetical protein ACFLVC_00105 [Chloroflexota bacterium]
MNKRILLTFLAVLLILTLSGSPVLAKEDPKDNQTNGTPFQELWDAVNVLKQWVENFSIGWGDIQDIPAGFADGVDNEGVTTESDPTVTASVKDGVDWTELGAIPAGFADGVDDTGLPVGAIIMWSGTIDANGNPVISGSPDTNWHICDGTSGTPDLRNRFIVGAGGGYSIGAIGGENTHSLSISEIPSHDHYLNLSTDSGGLHYHLHTDRYSYGTTITGLGVYLGANNNWSDTTRATGSSGNHDHDVSGNTNNAGGGQAHENRPPYYGLAYIMRVP